VIKRTQTSIGPCDDTVLFEARTVMSEAARMQMLRIALIAVGLIATVGFYPLTVLWPSGWAWGHGH